MGKEVERAVMRKEAAATAAAAAAAAATKADQDEDADIQTVSGGKNAAGKGKCPA